MVKEPIRNEVSGPTDKIANALLEDLPRPKRPMVTPTRSILLALSIVQTATLQRAASTVSPANSKQPRWDRRISTTRIKSKADGYIFLVMMERASWLSEVERDLRKGNLRLSRTSGGRGRRRSEGLGNGAEITGFAIASPRSC